MNVSLASLNLLIGSKMKNIASMKIRDLKTIRENFYRDKNTE